MTEEDYDPMLIDAYLDALDRKDPMPEMPGAEEAYARFQKRRKPRRFAPGARRAALAACLSIVCALGLIAWVAGVDIYGTVRLTGGLITTDGVRSGGEEAPRPEKIAIAKTYERLCTEILTDDKGRSCAVAYTLQSTIYYDPDTYRISEASDPVKTSIKTSWPDFYRHITTTFDAANSVIVSDGLSASFYYTFKLNGTSVYGDTEFGRVFHSFTVTPEEEVLP